MVLQAEARLVVKAIAAERLAVVAAVDVGAEPVVVVLAVLVVMRYARRAILWIREL